MQSKEATQKMKNKSIQTRYVFGVQVKLVSPVCVSSGEENYTDSDIQRDFDGKAFIPGTSLAGAMKGYLNREEDGRNLFGYSKGEEGILSPIWISDLHFDEEENKRPEIIVRDGIKLEKKITVKGAKYDMEAVETGTSGKFHMELVIRDGNPEEIWLEELKEIFSAINRGDIRFGANKNRGFGKFEIEKIYLKEFTKENIQKWIAFKSEDVFKGNPEDLKKYTNKRGTLYKTISVPLTLKGGISIRKYSTKPGDVDFEHITSNGDPIIPGTSWNGAIRTRAGEIMDGLGISAQPHLDEMFGFVDEKKNTAKQSNIIISESILEGSKELEMTRNKINRFDAATIESALYKERACFEGNVDLEIKVRCDHGKEKWQIGLLLLVIQDIQNGYLPVGGQTAVGRGIFEGKLEQILLDGKQIEKAEYDGYMKKLLEERRM